MKKCWKLECFLFCYLLAQSCIAFQNCYFPNKSLIRTASKISFQQQRHFVPQSSAKTHQVLWSLPNKDAPRKNIKASWSKGFGRALVLFFTRVKLAIRQAAHSAKPLFKAAATAVAALVIAFSSGGGSAHASDNAYGVFNNRFIDESHIILDGIRPTQKEANEIAKELRAAEMDTVGILDEYAKLDPELELDLNERQSTHTFGDDVVINYGSMFDNEFTEMPLENQILEDKVFFRAQYGGNDYKKKILRKGKKFFTTGASVAALVGIKLIYDFIMKQGAGRVTRLYGDDFDIQQRSRVYRKAVDEDGNVIEDEDEDQEGGEPASKKGQDSGPKDDDDDLLA
eukprot:CAMPEP_0117753746 /NCGR_PEP_ID=MMETSP0947-20121206/12416_1 /TAXON_ID=44440 /ORGANISM="Chattonella subsalsa, Strain CCMP2191" /LENGTH=340 /DNA_ID=CAMNT_0005572701 /DNA_START=63 /DNA_END=1085 /DNA_ORIENTATION=-